MQHFLNKITAECSKPSLEHVNSCSCLANLDQDLSVRNDNVKTAKHLGYVYFFAVYNFVQSDGHRESVAGPPTACSKPFSPFPFMPKHDFIWGRNGPSLKRYHMNSNQPCPTWFHFWLREVAGRCSDQGDGVDGTVWGFS